MINVTERAKQELKRLLAVYTDMPQGRLRLMDRGQGDLGLGLDIEMPDDEFVLHEGSPVLVVEHGLAENVKGLILDVEESAKGSELVIGYA
ncbi:hypothetical protein ACFLXG_02730 [Chloroflexota bacterium]